MKATTVELTAEEMEGLIHRLETETLCGDDLPTIKAIIKTYLLVIQMVQEKKATIKKLLRMIFGVKTEKAKTVLSEIACSDKPEAGRGEETFQDSSKPRGHGRNGAAAYTGAKKITVAHPAMSSGDICPGCERGKVCPPPQPGGLCQDHRRGSAAVAGVGDGETSLQPLRGSLHSPAA